MVEAFLTMPTFALQSLYDMHSASGHVAEDLPMPEGGEEAPAPAPEGGEVAPAPEGGEGAPAEGGEGAPAGGGDLGGDMGGGMDLGMGGGGGGMGMGGEMGGEASPEVAGLKAENEALVGDIQQLEQDFAKLQETLPEGGALDLSSILSEDAMDDKAEQLPGGAEGEDPALNFMPEGEEHTSSLKADDVDDDGAFERDLLGALRGVDSGEQKSDPALPEQFDEHDLLNQVDVEEADYADLPENILGDLAAAAGTLSNAPAMPKAANVKVASAPKTGGAKMLPSGTVAPASPDDQQVSRLASLLKDFTL